MAFFGYKVIYEQRVEKRGKNTLLESSSVQDNSAGHNAVNFDNLWPLQKKEFLWDDRIERGTVMRVHICTASQTGVDPYRSW